MIGTIGLVSLTPGLCMSLAFSLGLSLGYRKTLWMMAGEMLGVATVIITTAVAMHWLLALDPRIMTALALVAASYLLWMAWQLWHADDSLHRQRIERGVPPLSLFALGLTTALFNPKGWAFTMALLPGFIAFDASLAPQVSLFVAVMLSTEFASMSLYAGGGGWLRKRLGQEHQFALLSKTAAVLMVAVSLLIIPF
ncbi:homogentisate export protein [Luminiphilus syltensis NOR5-1B]|uniref:Homogentisate export protein n=2 Tax=Luminiphilus TaxID=1341118 RepID=B8KV23_9GAMM|nr:homogentisate export protein [Luminiphilus syltensis NOR5-1B]